MRAKALLCLLLGGATLVGVVAAGSSHGAPAPKPIKGGTFRIALHVNPLGVDSIDPALIGGRPEELLLRATCAQLMAFPGPTPEAAAGYPKVSRNRLTYTFTIKKGLRFNTGEPVTARNFARGIIRTLSPEMRAQSAAFFAELFLGGPAFAEGKEKTLRGVIATGQTLVLRLAKPHSQLLYDLALPGGFCPVPAALPIDPEGVGAPLPGSGPYYISRFVPGREVVLERNRRYRGPRPQRVDRFTVDLTSSIASTAQRVETGQADLAFVAPPAVESLVRKYGINRSQLFAHPATDSTPRMIVLNSSRPLFRNNARLRRAVNFAVDRQALSDATGPNATTPTDQYLVPSAAGFRRVRIYPVRGDIRKAQALARGQTRSGKAVFYVSEGFPFLRAQAVLVQERLRQIGVEAEIRTFPHPVFLRKLFTPGEPYDLALSLGFSNGYPDHTSLNWMFHGRRIPPADGGNAFYFNSPRFNRLLDRAERLAGLARLRLYASLDVELARDAAPAVPTVLVNTTVFVSRRAGCQRFDRALFDLAAVCLTRR